MGALLFAGALVSGAWARGNAASYGLKEEASAPR
jgi:hypothetical protein